MITITELYLILLSTLGAFSFFLRWSLTPIVDRLDKLNQTLNHISEENKK
jgi:hypothetical protein